MWAHYRTGQWRPDLLSLPNDIAVTLMELDEEFDSAAATSGGDA